MEDVIFNAEHSGMAFEALPEPLLWFSAFQLNLGCKIFLGL